MSNGPPLAIPLPSGARNGGIGTGLEVVAFAPLVGLVLWALAIDHEVSQRVSDAAARLPILTYWNFARFEPVMFVGLFAFLVMRLSGGANASILRVLGWSAFGACLAAMVGLNVYSTRHYSGGVATAEKAILLNARGETFERSWTSADLLSASCATTRNGLPQVRFQIGFEGQVAALERRPREPIAHWLEVGSIVDAKLPPLIKVSRKAFEWRCFEAETAELPYQGKVEFLRLFRPTPRHAVRFAKESEAWGQIALQAVRERERTSVRATLQ